jgi:hypothetical protein
MKIHINGYLLFLVGYIALVLAIFLTFAVAKILKMG